jgi:hypothetical protein
MAEFTQFQKIPRLSREVVVTEKIDGTNACVYIGEDGEFLAGSRTRWITPADDNFGFARWAYEHKDELMGLGIGRHFGEWWGSGIQRGYGLKEKRWSLFNTSIWGDDTVRPACCGVVPVLYRGPFTTEDVDVVLASLKTNGSAASPGFMKPEGVVVYHVAAGSYFKKTIEKDAEWKGKQ